MSSRRRYNFDQNIIKMNEPLPRVPSQLIRLALDDLEKAEKRDDTKIDMNMWAYKVGYGKCKVCLAGAVMRERCVDFDKFLATYCELLPSNFSVAESSCLAALNEFRGGWIAQGVELLDRHVGDMPYRVNVRKYHEDPAGFKEDMSNMASYLEGLGL